MVFRAFEQLPLFADDTAIGGALLGPQRACEWSAIASLLEGRGLPKIDALNGRSLRSSGASLFRSHVWPGPLCTAACARWY